MPVSTLYITAASKQLETHSECVLIWLKSHTLIVILTSGLSSSIELCSSSFSANGWNHKEMAMFGQSNDLTWCHQCWGMYRISPAFKTTCNQHNPLNKERLLKFIFYKGWGSENWQDSCLHIPDYNLNIVTLHNRKKQIERKKKEI